jgi:hypothetical protein
MAIRYLDILEGAESLSIRADTAFQMRAAPFITAIFFTWQGGPAGPGGGCRYRVASHGVYTCGSKAAYDLAGAAEQRIAAGGFLCFFAVHLYAALARGQADWGASS